MKTEQLETQRGHTYPSAYVQTYPQTSQVRSCVAFDGGNRFIKWVDPFNEVRVIPSCIKEVSETHRTYATVTVSASLTYASVMGIDGYLSCSIR